MIKLLSALRNSCGQLPALSWLRTYNGQLASSDGLAAIIVTILLIPQSLAYAMLAGLPAQMGLYASILPLAAYALFGSSRVLAVGPVAIVSLLTASSVSQIAEAGSYDYISAAILLAALSGFILFAMGTLRLGWIASLLSHPVMSGFINASGILIAITQFKHILGIPMSGHNIIDLGHDLFNNAAQFNLAALSIGTLSLSLLIAARLWLKPLLQRLGLALFWVELLSKAGPVFAVVFSILAVKVFELTKSGLAIAGNIPQGLPSFALPVLDVSLITALLPAALIISLIGFVESVSVAQSLGAKRRQQIDPNHELLGLGAANMAASLSGGYPVTGGFARSVVNYEAGAVSPMAGIFTAIGIAVAALFLTPLFFYLPHATLAATIIIAVSSLLDFGSISETWRFSKIDFTAMAATMALVLFVGVEAGIVTGVVISLALHLWKTSRPHIAEIGLVPGTQHFRNKERHNVISSEEVYCARIDESLYFANTRFLENRLYNHAINTPAIKHVVLMCSAINSIDFSALEGLESLNERLSNAGVNFHLSEVKGPVMDQLKQSHFLDNLSGKIFLSQYQAYSQLCNDLGSEITPCI